MNVFNSVDSLEHSKQCEWNGRFLVTSQANFILSESIDMKSSSILITSWPESNAPVLFAVVPMNNIGGDSILNFNEAGEIDKEFDELLGDPCRPGMLKENLLLL
jgi:hypothetical protein